MTEEVKFVQIPNSILAPLNEVVSILCDCETNKLFKKTYNLSQQTTIVYIAYLSTVKYTDGFILGKKTKASIRSGLWSDRERVAYAILEWDKNKSISNVASHKSRTQRTIQHIGDIVRTVKPATTKPTVGQENHRNQLIHIAKTGVQVDVSKYDIAMDFYCTKKDSNGGKTDAEVLHSMLMENAKRLHKRIQVADTGTLQQQATITALTSEFNKTAKTITDIQTKNQQPNDIIKAMLNHQAENLHKEILSPEVDGSDANATDEMQMENDVNNLIERLKEDYFDKHPTADEETQLKAVYHTQNA